MMDGALTHSLMCGVGHIIHHPSSIPHGMSYKWWWWACWFTLVNFLTLVNEEFFIGHCAFRFGFGIGIGFWFGLSFFFCVCKMGLE
jgi:hypothetical protein